MKPLVLYHASKVHQLTLTDAAYLAGLIDGEGFVGVTIRVSGRRGLSAIEWASRQEYLGNSRELNRRGA